MTTDTPFRLSAVGDISFEGPEAENPSFACFENIATEFSRAHLVVGNLECVLTNLGCDGIPGKCTLRGSPKWAQVLRNAGIGVVSLANNHIMDYGTHGLFSTIEALKQAGVHHVGAGRNRQEACSPLFLNLEGRRIAILARTAVVVSSRSYAGENEPGVAFLDPDEAASAIRSCRSQVDIVILLIHWGLEQYSYPSPAQRQLARRLVAVGADVILGHHPHVLQGVEYVGAALIVYSLGNFVFNEFEWAYVLPDGTTSRQAASLSLENRQGLIATLDWTGAGRPVATTTYIKIARSGQVRVDLDPTRELEMQIMSAGMLRRSYQFWWHWYALRCEWSLRLGRQISFRRLFTNLHQLRPRHLVSLWGSFRRSFRVASGKTTNPYE